MLRGGMPRWHPPIGYDLCNRFGPAHYLLVRLEVERRRSAGTVTFLAVLSYQRRDVGGKRHALALWRLRGGDRAAVHRRLRHGDVLPGEHGVERLAQVVPRRLRAGAAVAVL